MVSRLYKSKLCCPNQFTLHKYSHYYVLEEKKRSPLFSNENVWRLEKTLAQISPWGLLHFATSPERLAAATRPEHANVSPKRKKNRGGV